MQVSSIKFSATENNNMIKRATSLLDQAISDVRRISHNMMPGLLTKFGIFEAIRDLIDKINETQELSASLKVQGSEERLPEKVEIMIYRITQELINNTLKHAGAKVITIEIHMLPEQINITYADDGVAGHDAS